MGPSIYTNKYLNSIGADMKFMAEGTKYEMHYWQHKMIINYTKANGVRPLLNKSDW